MAKISRNKRKTPYQFNSSRTLISALAILLMLMLITGTATPVLASCIDWQLEKANNESIQTPPLISDDIITPVQNPLTVATVTSTSPVTGTTSTGLTALSPIRSDQAEQSSAILANLPLFFIENRGLIDKQVLFYTEGGSQGLYFTPQGLTFTLTKAKNPPNKSIGPDTMDRPMESPKLEQERWAVKLVFLGADPEVKPRGEASTPTRISYFKGQPEDWETGLPTYSQIVYPELWPGIDLVFKGGTDGLKYEFVVAPGADPSLIRLAWRGVDSVTINDQGQMEIKTPIGGFTDQTPLAWQEDGSDRQTVDVGYQLNSRQGEDQEWGFKMGCFNADHELIIDPVIIDYCGYIGGSGNDHGKGIAVDSSGRAYVIGNTSSTEAQSFPVSVGPDISHNGGIDIFVARVAADGTTLDYCSYIGGSGSDYGSSIAVDSSGCAYVTGYTASTEAQGFPVSGGPDINFNGGSNDAFVARVAEDGAALEYCGYIGGLGIDSGSSIAVDSSGCAYVTGYTASTEAQGFPVKTGPDISFNGSGDAFVARVADDGAALEYCGYIGGLGSDSGYSIAVDSNRLAYVIGSTASTEAQGFPVNIGPDITHNGGTNDAFVARIAASGASLEYCGYIGGAGSDSGSGVAVDSSGRAYVTGLTTSTETQGFPVSGGPDITYNGGVQDAFVARMAANGSSLEYCGYIGGSADDRGISIATDSYGRAYLTGLTSSTEATFPVSDWADATYGGGIDAFIVRTADDGTFLDYCSYLGGSGQDDGISIAIDTSGRAYITGYTTSTETTFPVTGGPDSGYNGSYDAYVTRIIPQSNLTDIFTFSLPQQTGAATINNAAHTVNIQVANGTLLTSLTPTITVSAGATINPASGTAQNFSAPFTYTVTAENGTTQDWTVTVTVALSSAHDILTFSLPEQTGAATINNVTHTVNIEVANGTILTSLTPTISISPGAGISPASGTAQNFSVPFNYTVTAENGTPQTWTVTVTVASSSANDILNFTLPEQTAPATIDSLNHTVNIEVANGTAMTNLTPTIAVSAGAAINPASGTAQDSSAPVTYTVTAEDGTPQTWTVTVTAALSSAHDILAFTLPQQTGAASIDNTAHTVRIEVAAGTVLNGLTPSITVSPRAVINPASGVVQDFSNPLTYTVTAENGTAQIWTVTVTVAAAVIIPPSGGDGGGDSYSPPAETGVLIGSSGGNINQNGLVITIPAGALAADSRFIIKQVIENSIFNIPSDAMLIGRVFDVVKDQSNDFKKAVTITISFDKGKIDLDSVDLKICFYDETTSTWVPLQNINVDKTKYIVSGEITHFTKFALLAFPRVALKTERSEEEGLAMDDKTYFTDISGHWAEASIKQMASTGVINGYANGCFKPNNNITRAEFVTLLVNALKINSQSDQVFKDTKKHWARESIAAAVAAGIVNGREKDLFSPDDLITREEIALMVVRATRMDKPALIAFKDKDQISPWARSAVDSLAGQGILAGYPDGSFDPQGKATRAEAVNVVLKAMEQK